jgi:ankyrin repeat protein
VHSPGPISFTNNATSLHLVSKNGHVEVARMLIERGEGVTAKDIDEDTPLHLVSRWEQEEVAHLLIEHGPDVTAQDKHGETAQNNNRETLLFHLASAPP